MIQQLHPLALALTERELSKYFTPGEVALIMTERWDWL